MLDIAPGDQALSDCYARMAKITSDVLLERDRAIELWRRVLDLRGADPQALSALADLHEQAEDWRELTEVLDSQIRATDDPVARIPLYRRLGRVWGDKLGRERNALECWRKVAEIDPGDVEALRAIADNCRSAGAWEELTDILRRTISVGGHALTTSEIKELYAQLGELEGSTLMRIDAAIEAWRQVLRLDAADFRALSALEKLFTQEGRWEECVEVLERRVAVLQSPDEKVAVLVQVASIRLDKVGDGGAATETYERVLEIDPSHLQASTSLEDLYRQRKLWPKLVELLLARIEYVDGPPERIKLFCAIATVYEAQMGDRDSAFVTLQAAFREDYSNDHVAEELERLATATGKWNDLLTEYTQVAQGMTDVKQAADLWVKDRALVRLRARSHRVRHRRGQKGLVAGLRPLGGHGGPGGFLSQGRPVEGAGHHVVPPRRARAGHRTQGGGIAPARRSVRGPARGCRTGHGRLRASPALR